MTQSQPYLDSDFQSRWFDFGGDTVIRADKYVPPQAPAPAPTAAAAATTTTITSSTFPVSTPATILRLVLLLLLHDLDNLFGNSKVLDLWGISWVCAIIRLIRGRGEGDARRANVRYFL